MQKDSHLKVENLKIDGGAVANDFLCQFQSDILGINIIRPKIIETTSLGAAYLAGLAVGYWKDSREIMRCWQRDAVFKPQMEMRVAQKLYNEWRDAVKRILTRRESR